ncbi:uncharacterized protein LOC113518928 isoform X2 [Galleria mellonella]|uniref:Uncharacterized protein LOC113518928 isoform X2 n=1 Tax=Galleria mellonella TaxID=7137 RepID=A0A6J1WVC8_GALME|nr:uncharacterized protein LOC113518928 isoform X2 [Galleria mellonella]
MYTLIEIAISVGVFGALVTAVSACVCGCKNSNQKASTQNSQRSLPEIPHPHPVGRHDSGDTASEIIYATVNLDEGSKAVATTSTGRDHPYEHAYAKLQSDAHNITVEITPDQGSESDIQIDEREALASGPESVVISASVAISGQLPSSQELPYITPPSPRPHTDTTVHFSGDSTDSAKGYTSISVREPLSNIRAQSTKPPQPHYATVSDDSDETYAAIEEASVGEGSDTYAQIAPEPRRRDASAAPALSPIPATAHAPAPSSDLLNADAAHSARRSAPPEIGATSSNATHSRQASSSSCTNSTGATAAASVASAAVGAGSPKPEKRQANSPLPPPPPPQTSRHHHAHQRISSTGDLHSHDKLRRSLNEKHQRNNSCVSSSDFYGCNYPVEKHRFSSSDLIRPLVAKELNFDLDQRENPADNLYNSIDGPGYSDYSSADANTSMNSEQRTTESPSRNVEEMYAKVMKKAKGRTDETVRRSKDISNDESNNHTSKYRGDDPGYETIDRKKSINHGYETIAHKERKNSQNQDPGYETVKDIKKIGPNTNFTNNNLLKLNHATMDSGPNSIISSDHGYEHISKTDNNASDSDPNYEVLRNQPPTPPYATIPPNYKVQPTYSTVNKRPAKYNNWPTNNNEEPALEPNYESMPHDPLYTTGSESDPNYESVRPKDSNYESVINPQDPNYESLRCKDPKYESVRSKDPKYDSVRSKKDPNYESVKYFELSKREPPYEKVNNEATSSATVERSDSAAGYEKINVPNNRDPKSSINNGPDGIVSDYFQV